MRDDEPAPGRRQGVETMVDHLAASGWKLATPGDPVAKLRRAVLRGLRGPK